MSVSLNESILKRSSIVSGIKTLSSIASQSSQVDSYLNMQLQESVADVGDLKKALIALWYNHRTKMRYIHDGMGRASFAKFKVGEWRFYLVVARSGMADEFSPDDFYVFSADTQDHLQGILQGKTSDKYLSQWLLLELKGWDWPLIETQWVKGYEVVGA
jgi:hypothetical protein